MYVKLAFSVAAHLDSEIMVMDEVLAVGDMKFQQKCLGRMGDAANSEGRTVLYVSHNMNTIRQLCKRCIVMDHGRIIFDGDTETAISIYMQNNAQMQLVNPSPEKRPYGDSDERIHVDCVTFLDRKEYPFYDPGEKVRLQVDYTAAKPVENFSFRITLQTLDKIRVSMTTTAPVMCAKEGRNSVILEFPTDWVAPGKYASFLVAYSVNDFGRDQVHDRLENAFAFEIVQNGEENNRVTWNHTAWGFMMMPQLEVAGKGE